jgi:hypothetical protein
MVSAVGVRVDNQLHFTADTIGCFMGTIKSTPIDDKGPMTKDQ